MTLLDDARGLLTRPSPATVGLWPRAAALLARQALEETLSELWRAKAPGVEKVSARAQLLCLEEYVADAEARGQIRHLWGALSRACHHHPYELAPTAGELKGWLEAVERVRAGR